MPTEARRSTRDDRLIRVPAPPWTRRLAAADVARTATALHLGHPLGAYRSRTSAE